MHGLPQVIVSDNGPAFVGPDLAEFLQRNKARHMRSPPYHPASNGQAERMVRTFKESMKSLQHGDIETKLSRLLFSYRTTRHSVTGRTPAELLFKGELQSAFHLLKPDGHLRMKRYQSDMEKQSGSRVQLRKFRRGDLVWVRNFARGEKWLPGVVERNFGAVDYDVVLEGTKAVMHRHVDQLVRRSSQFYCDVEGVDSASGKSTEVTLPEAGVTLQEGTEGQMLLMGRMSMIILEIEDSNVEVVGQGKERKKRLMRGIEKRLRCETFRKVNEETEVDVG